MTIEVTRRTAMLGAGALTLLPKSLLAQVGVSPILRIGNIEIRVISDGYLTVPARFLATNVDEVVLKQWLAADGHDVDLVTPPANVTLVQTPNEVILIDVGGGSRFMPTLGKLADNLQTIG